MHPPLDRPHPDCQEAIQNLKDCHEEHKFAKFFGKCNQFKADLDKCFRQEKEVKRAANLKKAREFEAKFEEFQRAQLANNDSTEKKK